MKIKIISGLLLLFSYSSIIAQNNPDSKPAPYRISKNYIDAYWNRDIAAIKQFIADKTIFIDETATTAFGMKMPIVGSNIVSSFTSSFSQIKNIKINDVKSFHSGEHSIFHYSTEYEINGKKKKNQVITIIRTKKNKVIEHREYADY